MKVHGRASATQRDMANSNSSTHHLASRWLAEAASEGYCATTVSGRTGDCQHGAKGSFGLPVGASDSWATAVSWCLAKCEACSRCNYIDVTIRWGDCSWHHRCDENALLTDVHQILSGPALRTLGKKVNPRAGGAHRALPSEAIAAISPTHYAPAMCTSAEHRGGNTVTVLGWSGMGTGFNMVAAAFALHRAACCGGSALFPELRPRASWRDNVLERGDHGHMTLQELLGERNRTCFSFGHVPRVTLTSDGAAGPKDACQPSRKSSYNYFQDGGVVACPSVQYYWRPTLLALLSYLDLERALPACSSFAIDFDRTLVAHVRSGDIFAAKTHADYGQPPLAYYLSAWADSGLSDLHIVTESYRMSPVARLLRLLQATSVGGTRVRVQAGGADDFRRDLGTLMCARHLTVARSSMTTVLLTNRRLRTVYSSAPLGTRVEGTPVWSASCRTRVRVAQGVHREAVWRATDAQKLALLQDQWDQRIPFVDAPVQCLGLESTSDGPGGTGAPTVADAKVAATTTVSARAAGAAAGATAVGAVAGVTAAVTAAAATVSPPAAGLAARTSEAPAGESMDGGVPCMSAAGVSYGWRGYCAETPFSTVRLPTEACRPPGGALLEKGSWKLVESAEACLELCTRCTACRYVSYSYKLGDCSWFTTCNKAALHTEQPTGHCTFEAGESGPGGAAWRRSHRTPPAPPLPPKPPPPPPARQLDAALASFPPSAQYLLFSLVTTDLVSFAQNWLCSLRASQLTFQRSLAVFNVASDRRACRQLERYWPHGAAAASFRCHSDDDPLGSETGPLVFQSRGYLEGVRRKLWLVADVAHATGSERFRWLLYVDVDIVVRADPFAFLEAHHAAHRTAGVVFAKNVCSRGRDMNSGLLGFTANNRSRLLIDTAVRMLARGFSADLTDQGAFDSAAQLHPHLAFVSLPCSRFAPGYTLAAVNISRLVTLHFNWMWDSSIKLKCAQASGQWALSGPGPGRDGVCRRFDDTRRVVVKKGDQHSEAAQTTSCSVRS